MQKAQSAAMHKSVAHFLTSLFNIRARLSRAGAGRSVLERRWSSPFRSMPMIAADLC